MAIRFDHNNNSEEWQMLFNKINNRSPFGVIKEVFFYDYSPNNKLLSAKSHDFGKDLNSMDVELSNPNTFVQSLLKLGSFSHGKTIEFLDNPTNYPPVTLAL